MQRVLARWRRGVEPWYVAYLLVGAATGGIGPILMPLVVSRAGDASHVGLVMAAVGLGGLTAALWGDLADRLRWHRVLFAGGPLVAAGALAAFGTTTSLPVWMGLALLLGMGTAAANTVASLFVVEEHPQAEWDERIGLLQTCYNAGIVAGLAVAGSLSELPLELALLVGAGALAGAGIAGWLLTRNPPAPAAASRTSPAAAQHKEQALLTRLRWHRPHMGWGHLASLYLIHLPRRQTLAQLGATLRSPFGLFLFVWLVCNLGTNAVFTLYPLLVDQVYDVEPGPSSFALAVAVGLGLLLYTPASLLTHRIGGVHVLQIALAVRLLAYVVLVAMLTTAFPGREFVVLSGFALVELAFPAMTVSSTVLTSRLSQVGEGEGMGLYTAVAAAAGLAGAVLGGWLAATAGYASTLWLAIATGIAALVLTVFLRTGTEQDSTPPTKASQS